MKVSAVLIAAAAVLATACAEETHAERKLAMRPNPNTLPETFFPMNPDVARRLTGMNGRLEAVLKAKKKMQGVLEPTTLVPQEEKRRLEEMGRLEAVLKAKKKMQGVLEPTTLVPQEEKRRLEEMGRLEAVLKAKKKMQGVLEPTTLVPQEEKRSLRA